MYRWLSQQFRACGKAELEPFEFRGNTYHPVSLLKDDFFAATALYVSQKNGVKVVLKTARYAPFFFLPMQWLGAFLCRHELYLHQKLDGLDSIPKILGPHGRTGFVYKYIEGLTLDEGPVVPDDFFDHLENLLQAIHARRIAYLDLNKRGNVIVGADGKPHLIDF